MDKSFTSAPKETITLPGNVQIVNRPVNLSHVSSFYRDNVQQETEEGGVVETLHCITFSIPAGEDVKWYFDTAERQYDCFERLKRMYCLLSY